jgi:hypothetical protein
MAVTISGNQDVVFDYDEIARTATTMGESAANIKAYADSFNDIAEAIAESDQTIANDVAAAQEG